MAEQESPPAEDEKETDHSVSSDSENDDGFIMLTEDEGVQKKIILPGDEDDLNLPQTPPRNATVQCHYIARTLQDGRQFDSSRERGQSAKKKHKNKSCPPFEFQLGTHIEWPAWQIVIPTMKRHEICIVRCSPRYGYGDQSDVEKARVIVPPNSWLEFEIELLGWNEWQFLSFEYNGIRHTQSIRKKVLCNGSKPMRPRVDDIVTLSYKGYIPSMENRIFAAKDHVNVVCDDDGSLTEGFHVAMQQMEEGERAIVEILDYELAYGVEGDIDLDIPYLTDISYEIELHHVERAKEMKECNDLELMEKARKFKKEGNELYGRGVWHASMKKYQKALRWAQCVESSEFEKEKIQLIVDVNNNIGLIWMKREDHEKVIEFALKVLECDEKNVKALCRAGHAMIKQKDYMEAKTHLKRAKAVDPNNAYVQKLWSIAVSRLKQERERQKKQFHAMFGYRPEKKTDKNKTENT